MKAPLTFLAGALVPAVSLYLTGGSNRFMFCFGLTLGISLLLLPVLIWPKCVSEGIWKVATASEQFMLALRGHKARDLKDTKHSTVLEDSVRELREPDGELPSGIEGDCVSALHNLGLAVGKAKRIVRERTENKRYSDFESLFQDCIAVSGRTR